MSVNIYNAQDSELNPIAGREAGGINVSNVMSLEEITEASSFTPKDVPSAEAVQEINSNLNHYSKTEKKIGKWHNGDDIYQIVIEGKLSSGLNGSYLSYDATSLNIKKIISMKCVVSSGSYQLAVPSVWPADTSFTYLKMYYVESNKRFLVEGTNTVYIGEDVVVTLEYTKN